MSHTAFQADGQISRLNIIALTEEIGERLRFGLDSDRAATPMHLLQLMMQFQRAEHPGNGDVAHARDSD
jgi:hypothetical protein